MGGTPRGPGASRPPGEQPTFAVAGEPVGLDHVLLDLGGHGQEELQHLAHVIAGIVPSLLHALRVLGRPERLDHLRQHGCGTRALSRPPASRIQLRDMGTTRASRPGDGTSRTHPWPVRRSAPAVPRAARRPPWSAAGRPRPRPGPTAADGHRSPARAERACASPPLPALHLHRTVGAASRESGKPAGQILKELKSLPGYRAVRSPHLSPPTPRSGRDPLSRQAVSPAGPQPDITRPPAPR